MTLDLFRALWARLVAWQGARELARSEAALCPTRNSR